MSAPRQERPWARRLLGRASFLGASCVLHLAVYLVAFGGLSPAEAPTFPLQLPAELDFGVSATDSGGSPAPEPAPAKAEPQVEPRAPRAPRARPREDWVVRQDSEPARIDAGVAEAPDGEEEIATAEGGEEGAIAEASGQGLFPGGDGEGGFGFGGAGGNGRGVEGATIALNVDVERLRKSALLLETEALLGIVPEWSALLSGSGIDPLEDLTRVFVATPNLRRSSLVVSARHRGGRPAIEAAVRRLAAERGQRAELRTRGSVQIAPWWNRGPTRRSVALAADRFTITQSESLERVLAVARALEPMRARQGFAREELAAQGALLAMQEHEAAALWVEGLRTYVPSAGTNVPLALRMSIRPVDQFTTELRAIGHFESRARASEALGYVDGIRTQWLVHPRIKYLGLTSALESARIEERGNTLELRVQLTLHQTRYLLSYVSRALAPRGE